MGRIFGSIAALAGGVLIAACTVQDPFAIRTLDKTVPVDVRTLYAAHPGQTGCVDYRASDNSCASLIAAQVRENRLVAVETGAVRGLDGRIARVSLRSSSRIVNGGACLMADDISAVGDAGPMGDFLTDSTRLLISQYGGEVCARYFRSGDGYVITSRGSDGRPFPPGDTAFRFVKGPLKVRAQ